MNQISSIRTAQDQLCEPRLAAERRSNRQQPEPQQIPGGRRLIGPMPV